MCSGVGGVLKLVMKEELITLLSGHAQFHHHCSLRINPSAHSRVQPDFYCSNKALKWYTSQLDWYCFICLSVMADWKKKSNNKTKKTLIRFPSSWKWNVIFFFKGGSTPLLHKGLIPCLLSVTFKRETDWAQMLII